MLRPFIGPERWSPARWRLTPMVFEVETRKEEAGRCRFGGENNEDGATLCFHLPLSARGRTAAQGSDSGRWRCCLVKRKGTGGARSSRAGNGEIQGKRGSGHKEKLG
jgi:hypothetical protein